MNQENGEKRRVNYVALFIGIGISLIGLVFIGIGIAVGDLLLDMLGIGAVVSGLSTSSM